MMGVITVEIEMSVCVERTILSTMNSPSLQAQLPRSLLKDCLLHLRNI